MIFANEIINPLQNLGRTTYVGRFGGWFRFGFLVLCFNHVFRFLESEDFREAGDDMGRQIEDRSS